MSMNRKIIRYFCVVVLSLSCGLLGSGAQRFFAYASDEASDAALKQIQMRYSFILKNSTNHLLKSAEFWTYAPVKETSTQRCIKLKASHPYELISDDLGNQILYFRLENMPPYANELITIQAELLVSDKSRSIYSKNLNIFLKKEKFIEIDEPELSQLAKKIKSSTSTETAKNIFQWVADNVQYSGYQRDERGALYALRNKRGDCTESMYLFTALCRANAIPAQGIGGYVSDRNMTIKPQDYHNWAEFYDNGVWSIADPQRKNYMQKQSQYIAMRIIGESTNNPMGNYNRFRFAGDGLEVRMKD